MGHVREHWCRVAMYDAAAKLFANDAHDLDVLEISGTAFSTLAPWRSYESPTIPAIDVCKQPWTTSRGAGSYGLIVLDQVLEHVVDPLRALRNVLEYLPSGGRVFVSTPFLIRFHPSPVDLWRWTSDGLAILLSNAGFEQVQSDAWGNRACVVANFERWVDYKPGLRMDNERNFPVTVWAWGTKP